MASAEARALRALATACGIEPRYTAMDGTRVEASPDSIVAAARALGVDVAGPASAAAATESVRQERASRLIDSVLVCWDGGARSFALHAAAPATAAVTTEAGAVLPCRVARGRVSLPRLPHGYHQLDVTSGGRSARALVIAAPRTCYVPPATHGSWGVFVPAYALRTRGDDGAGDLRALGAFAAQVAAFGGSIIGTLPLLAGDLVREPSPYRPLSRLFWNELYAHAGPPRAGARAGARDGSLIDYRAVTRHRMRLLRAGAARGAPASGELAAYCRYRAARDRHGAAWRRWPEGMRAGRIQREDVDASASALYAQGQRLVARQLRRLSADLERQRQVLYLDVPIGVDPDGYDVWRHRDEFLEGATVGAPPDAFFTLGQDWSVPPPNPLQARERGYRYWIATLRHHMEIAGMLRLDHVMGLHRLYVIPQGASAREGVYMRQPAEELYAIVCLESQRNRCAVVGENLGTVPARVNSSLRKHRLGTMYIGQFNLPRSNVRPPAPRRGALASLNTHDMVPFAGFWRGADIHDQVARGLIGRAQARQRRAERAEEKRALVEQLVADGLLHRRTMDAQAVLHAWLRWLARSRARYVVIGADDLYLESEPQNRPGTGEREAPNWKRRLPASLEDGVGNAAAAAILHDVQEARRRRMAR